jgi:hypothetical protein
MLSLGMGKRNDSVSRSSSVRRRSGELAIQEEDEDEEGDEEDVEIVDEFSPIRPGEEIVVDSGGGK